MGSALGLTQGSDPSFGLGWNSHREGLEGGDSLLFPRTLLTQREGVRVNVCESAQGQAVFPSQTA